MGWPHCFKMHQGQGAGFQHTSNTREAPQREQQHSPDTFVSEPLLAHIRPEPTEHEKQSAEALKKEGNLYFGKAKYGAAIEVLELL